MNKFTKSKKGEEVVRSRILNIILYLILFFVIAVGLYYFVLKDRLIGLWDYTFSWIRK